MMVYLFWRCARNCDRNQLSIASQPTMGNSVASRKKPITYSVMYNVKIKFCIRFVSEFIALFMTYFRLLNVIVLNRFLIKRHLEKYIWGFCVCFILFCWKLFELQLTKLLSCVSHCIKYHYSLSLSNVSRLKPYVHTLTTPKWGYILRLVTLLF